MKDEPTSETVPATNEPPVEAPVEAPDQAPDQAPASPAVQAGGAATAEAPGEPVPTDEPDPSRVADPSDVADRSGVAASPAGTSGREEAMIAAATQLRADTVRDTWLRRCGVVFSLLLLALALLAYYARSATGDAGWVRHLAWLAWCLPAVGWGLHRAAEANTPGVDRMRSTVERTFRRRDEALPSPEAVSRPVPVAGMAAAGLAALVAFGGFAVPVERPKLDRAAVTNSNQALVIEAKAEALEQAGVLPPARADSLRERLRLLSASPRGYEEAEQRKAALLEAETELDRDAARVGREASERLRDAVAAAALAAAFDPEVRAFVPPKPAGGDPAIGLLDDAGAEPPAPPTAAELAGPGGLPGGAGTALVTMIGEALSGPAGPAGSRRLSLAPALRDGLLAADRAGDPPAAADLATASALLAERRDQLNRLLQGLSEAGFPLRRAATDRASIDPAALGTLLRRADRADPSAVRAAVLRLR